MLVKRAKLKPSDLWLVCHNAVEVDLDERVRRAKANHHTIIEAGCAVHLDLIPGWGLDDA